jgi:hypothetical protein
MRFVIGCLVQARARRIDARILGAGDAAPRKSADNHSRGKTVAFGYGPEQRDLRDGIS